MRRAQRRKPRTGRKFVTFLLLLVIGGLLFNYIRPLPKADASVINITSYIDTVKLAWPVRGQAAIGAKDFGVLATHGSQGQRPTASLAKLVTALAVLEKHPLQKGRQGPALTLTAKDIALFEKYYAKGGAVVKVQEGERISQYQALQAILLPSANNMADTLAVWAFGSMENYHVYANDYLKRHGLEKTVVAVDASGMSPESKSTPAELVRLGELALKNPVIAEIVAQKSANIPVHGTIYSANSRLGFNNIIGIKTGLTDEAGGCFLFAAKHTVEGRPVTIIGVITGASNLLAALNESEPLLNSAKPYFVLKTPIKAGEAFANLTTPWLSTAQVIARNDVSLVAWRGTTLTPRIEVSDIRRSLPAGAKVGTAVIASGTNSATTPLVLKEPIDGPTWQWRLKRF